MSAFRSLLKRNYYGFRLIHAFSSQCRVRFAPSPTGFLHLGGLRTALYNYMFARKNNGIFILRIEDTDKKRKISGSLQHVEDILAWAGIIPDEGPSSGGSYGPYIQSDRLHLYKEAAGELITKGAAYRCFCTDQQLNLRRKEALRSHQTPRYDNRCRFLTKEEILQKLSCNQPSNVRFKLSDQSVTFNDMINGAITMNIAVSEGDPVILKSDGYPTYHLANVVDDHLMNISHVLRGKEWQISTFKHILMYNALNWSPPHFAHLPLILNSDGTKLSKRQNDIQIQHLKDSGYFPEAVLNFVIQIGGIDSKYDSPSLQDLIDEFDLRNINPNSCRVEEKKLETCNQSYFVKYLDNDEGMKALIKQMKNLIHKSLKDREADHYADICTDEYIKAILLYHKNVITSIMELLKPSNMYLWSRPSLSIANVQQFGSDKVDVLTEIMNNLQLLTEDNIVALNFTPLFKNICKRKNFKFGHCMQLLRRILSGVKDGPPITDIIHILGLQESILRIQSAINLFENQHAFDPIESSTSTKTNRV